MPKRSAQEQIEQYEFKIRKLREKQRPRRRLVILSSSEDEESSGNETVPEQSEARTPEPSVPQDAASAAAPAPSSVPDTQVEPELDPELLSALGDTTDEAPKFGDKIHPNLAQRWLPLLKKGLPKETKDKLLKEYLVPENCQLLQAPKLNVEISAAVAESVRTRDKKIETAQQQLGIGISAINKAMSLLLTGDDKIQAIKDLGDGCRILTDLHFVETQARIKLLTPGLSKQFLNVIQDSDRDDTLFGNKLTDKIKASKVIEKQGLQIKKPTVNTQKQGIVVSSQPSTSRAQYSGNWTGPSRYSTNRGGGGGGRVPGIGRKTPATRKAAPVPTTRPAGQARPRTAPPQQQQ